MFKIIALELIDKCNSSRAGLIKKIKLEKNISGCSWGRLNVLSILSNGDLILCCQDWKRETKYGNIFENNLNDIIEGEHYKDILQKAKGKKKSDRLFICKRCEYSKGE